MANGMGGRGRFSPGTTEAQLLARWNREAERQADYRTTKRIINNTRTKEKTNMAAPDLSNYVDVATRIKLLIDKYPDASIICTVPKVVEVAGHTFIEVTAHVKCDETRQAVASAWEPFPGKTPYTRDSEMMNAETSAIGRAIGALGIGLTGSMATANEVANRQTTTTVVNNTTITQHGNPPSDKQLWLYKKLLKDAGQIPPLNINQMDKYEVSRAIEALKAGETPTVELPPEEPF